MQQGPGWEKLPPPVTAPGDINDSPSAPPHSPGKGGRVVKRPGFSGRMQHAVLRGDPRLGTVT